MKTPPNDGRPGGRNLAAPTQALRRTASDGDLTMPGKVRRPLAGERDALLCDPVTGSLMRAPVKCSDGFTYNLRTVQLLAGKRSPLSGQVPLPRYVDRRVRDAVASTACYAPAAALSHAPQQRAARLSKCLADAQCRGTDAQGQPVLPWEFNPQVLCTAEVTKTPTEADALVAHLVRHGVLAAVPDGGIEMACLDGAGAAFRSFTPPEGQPPGPHACAAGLHLLAAFAHLTRESLSMRAELRCLEERLATLRALPGPPPWAQAEITRIQSRDIPERLASIKLRGVPSNPPSGAALAPALRRAASASQVQHLRPVDENLLLDPITMQPMENPWFCTDGYTYDRSTVDRLVPKVSPFTRQPLRRVLPDRVLQNYARAQFHIRPRPLRQGDAQAQQADALVRILRRSSDPYSLPEDILAQLHILPLAPARLVHLLMCRNDVLISSVQRDSLRPSTRYHLGCLDRVAEAILCAARVVTIDLATLQACIAVVKTFAHETRHQRALHQHHALIEARLRGGNLSDGEQQWAIGAQKRLRAEMNELPSGSVFPQR